MAGQMEDLNFKTCNTAYNTKRGTNVSVASYIFFWFLKTDNFFPENSFKLFTVQILPKKISTV